VILHSFQASISREAGSEQHKVLFVEGKIIEVQSALNSKVIVVNTVLSFLPTSVYYHST